MSKRSIDTPGPSKRTRFQSPSRLEQTSTDFLQDDLAPSTKSKDRRSLKDASGYESDSTDDGEEGVVPSRSGKKKEGAGEDEDEDMFGELSGDEGAKDKGKSKEEKKEFLNLTDIEGQDFGHKSGNYVGERSDDDDSEYDSEEEQRKAAEGKGLDGPMAAELTAFNMKSELTEGRMTADGESYQTNDRDPHEQYDRWLEGTDRSAVRKARRAKREQDRAEKQREEREKEEQTGEGRREKEAGLMRGIVELLDRGETVLEGLQRHGADLEKERKKVSKEKGKKQTWAEKQRERRAILEGHGSTASGDMQVDDATQPENPFARLSTLISDLTALGHLDVYSMTRESLQRMIPAIAPDNQATQSGPGGVQGGPDVRAFEYRFSKRYLSLLNEKDRPIEREVFGPFPALTLLSWKASGAFGGPECENVEVRTTGPAGPGDWGNWREIVGK